MTDQTPETAPVLPPAQLLTRTEASARLADFKISMKPATLARLWSVGGDGPPCVHIRQKPFYPLDELDAWALRQRTGLRRSGRDSGSGSGVR